ncbi:MAG: methyltransferase [Clostridiales bacterium]|jgi:16S rRNA (guanine1207-N2)-methyltransferase|nr:methyltransferase [Clostridiales bacterium]
MSHYFIEDNSLTHNFKKIRYTFGGGDFIFTTDSGVFSKSGADTATDILLQNIPPLKGSILDLGCGYGLIGIVLAKTYNLALTQVDINGRALEVTKMNCEANKVLSEIIKSDCFGSVSGFFDTITLNPPIHAGKNVTYKMYEQAAAHLNQGGRFYVVTLKKHGAETTREKLADVFGNCETLYKKKGYYVFCCEKNTKDIGGTI